MADDSSTPTPAAAPPTGIQPAQAPSSAVKPADAPIKPLPPPRQPPSPQRVAARRRFLDGLLVAVVLAFAFLISLFNAHNNDFFFHAAAGRLIAHGDLRPMIGVDPFTFTSNGAYWANTNWLYDLIVYLFYPYPAAVGGTILILLKALMIAALAEVMLRTAREPGRSLWVPVCCVGLAVLTLSPRAQLQPISISFFFLGLTYWLLHLPRQMRARVAEGTAAPPRRPFLPYWLIPPSCLLWVNLDGWFFLGPATVALYLVGETLQNGLTTARPKERRARGAARSEVRAPRAAPGELRTLLWVLLASVAACLINPNHIHAFTLPSALGMSDAGAALGHDEQFQSLFCSPFESYYFYPRIGLNVAGLAFFPLVLLGLISFAAAQWVGRWSWERAFVWIAFFALAAWRAGAIPFFAVVAGPIAALNFLDFAATRQGAAPAGAGGAWAVGGRILTLLAGVLLLIAAVPGWLQAPQMPPWQWRRVGWTVEPDPALVRVMDRINTWQKEAGMEHGVRWFNDSPAVLSYLAWYCPGELGCIDAVRLPLYDKTARDFEQVRESLGQTKEGDAGIRARNLLRSFDVHFVICYEPNLLGPNSPLRTLLSDPTEWPLLYMDGSASVFGSRDPSQEEPPLVLGATTAGLMTAPTGPLLAVPNLVGDRFIRYEVPAEREAFGPLAVPAPAATEPPKHEWWAVLWTPDTPQSPEADEAAVQGLRFELLRQRWNDEIQAQWTEFWQVTNRLAQADAAAVYVGSGCAPSGPYSIALLKRSLSPEEKPGKEPEKDSENKLPPYPASPDQPLFSWLHRQVDFGPPAPLFLSIRAARRALTVKADDAQPYLGLAEAYHMLMYLTREGDRASMVSYPPGNLPYPLLLRQVQTKTALHHALELDPNNWAAVDRARELYLQTGFLDLSLHYAEEELRILGDSGKDVTDLRKNVDAFRKQVQQKEDTYLLKTANKRVTEKVQTAQEMGLGQKALDELMKVDWDAFDDKDPSKLFLEQRELNLMMQTGQVDEVAKELKEEEGKLRKGLGFDPTVGLPAYDWLRVQAAAAKGDYADADHWLEEIEKIMDEQVPLLGSLPDYGVVDADSAGLHDPDTRAMASLLVGNLILRQAPLASSPVWLPVPDCENMRYLSILGAANGPIVEPLSRAADMEAMRGWLALEAGNTETAAKNIDKALAMAPGGIFRARPLAELCREWLNEGK